MFLALAVMLNINKWVYFTMRIQANINIREYEIAEIVQEEQEDQELLKNPLRDVNEPQLEKTTETISDPWRS